MKEKNSAEIAAQGMESYRRGNEYVAQNKADEARQCYYEALDKGYVNFKSLLAAAMVEKTRGNKEEVLHLLRRACETNPEANVTRKLYLEELFEQKKYEEGWNYLLEQDEIFDKESRVYLEIKSRFASALQMKEPAKEAFLKLYEKYESREAALSLAVFALVEKQPETAKKYLELILKEGQKEKGAKTVLYAAAEELKKVCVL